MKKMNKQEIIKKLVILENSYNGDLITPAEYIAELQNIIYNFVEASNTQICKEDVFEINANIEKLCRLLITSIDVLTANVDGAKKLRKWLTECNKAIFEVRGKVNV